MTELAADVIIIKMRFLTKATLPTIAILFFLLISAFGVANALNQFQKSLHSDTTYHNLAAVNSKTPSEFFGGVGYSSQPILESLMRRFIFVPIFGDNERTVRIPDIFSWFLLTLLLPWLTFKALREEGTHENSLLLASTLLVSLWAASNQLLTENAVFGRHYEWCALISFLWFAAYRQKEFFKSNWFHCLSILYLNSHFFAWPIVGSAYLYQAIVLLNAKKKNRELATCFALAFIIFLISAIINWEGIFTLAIGDTFTGVPKSSNTSQGFLKTILSGISLGRTFRSAFEINYAFILLAVVGSGILKRNNKFLLSLGVLLASFIVIKGSSGFAFAPRYIIPFFGMAWWIVVEGVTVTLNLFSWFDEKNKPKVSKSWIKVSPLILASIFLVWFYSLSPKRVFQTALKSGIPKENFTAEFFEYEKIKKLDNPSLVIGGGGWPYLITLWYLRDQNKENPKVISTSQDWINSDSAKESLLKFEIRNPRVLSLIAEGGWPYFLTRWHWENLTSNVKGQLNNVSEIRTWKETWAQFKNKNPNGKTFVHFYNPMQCASADPKVFREIKQFSEGCIGEVVTIDSVERLEKFFSDSRNWN